MPRVTPVHPGLTRLPGDCDQPILPGSVAHALGSLSDPARDRTACHARDQHADAGAAAGDPAVLRTISLLADRRGIVSSRQIDAVGRAPVVCIAAAGDAQPPCTPRAAFGSERGELAARRLAQGLVICARQGLSGRERCAIDGGQRPAKARQVKRGRRQDGQRPAETREHAARTRLDTHRDAAAAAAAAQGESDAARDAKRRERLHKDARPRRDWRATHPAARPGACGGVRRAHRPDHASATMAPSQGVIQGSTGVAAVEAQTPVMVEAQAHGTGAEQARLVPGGEAPAMLRTPATVLTAAAGSHAEDHGREVAGRRVEASLCDHGARRREACEAGPARHQETPDPRGDKRPKAQTPQRFGPAAVRVAADGSPGPGPAGTRLYSNGSPGPVNGDAALTFRGAEREGVPGTRRVPCRRTPATTKTRQVACCPGKREGHASHPDRRQAKIDTALGRQMMARRCATVAPVCGNLRPHKRLDRFTRWRRAQVEGPWTRYGLTHPSEKRASHGEGR